MPTASPSTDEVRFDIPEGSEEPGLAVMVGFIATIPGADAAPSSPALDDEVVELPLTMEDLRTAAHDPTQPSSAPNATPLPSVDPERDAGLVFARTWSLQRSVDRVHVEERDRADFRAFDIARDGRLSLASISPTHPSRATGRCSTPQASQSTQSCS